MNKAAAGPGGALGLASRREDGGRVLSVSGQLTERECVEFVAALEKELAAGPQRLVLDLKELTYISSAGLGTLVSAHGKFREAGCRMILAGASDRVRKLLALTNLDRLIEAAEGVEEALARP